MAILGTRFDDFDLEREVLGDVELSVGAGRDRDEILEVALGADVILAGAAPRFDAETLDRLGCGAIVRLGVGVDSIDLEAARRLGMWVSHVPDYGTEAVALHAVTLALAAVRRLPMADRHIRGGSWGFSTLMPLHLPAALTVGVIGYGRIGRRVVEMLQGVGFSTFLIHDPFIGPESLLPGHRLCSLDETLAEADLLTLHAPPPDDGHLIGAAELATMREGSIVVNSARGRLIDTVALVAALQRGRPAVAALDVFEQEPPDMSSLQAAGDRLILTPHMSWYTEETAIELRREGAAEARRILSGEQPANPVVTPEEATAR